MKLLFSSRDLADLSRLIRRLIWARVPCAVRRDPVSAGLEVWIQKDNDFPLALHVFTDRDAPRRLPYWARALEGPLPRLETRTPPAHLPVPANEATWTGAAGVHRPVLAWRQIRPAKLGPLAPTNGDSTKLARLSPQTSTG